MPSYTFERPVDGATTQRKLTFDQYDQVMSGALKVVDDDGVELVLVFNPQGVGFVLKDGPSGGWVSKAGKENKYRRDHAQVMDKKTRDHVFKSRLVPNLNGQEASSWKEVQAEVRGTQGAFAASTYDSHVSKEATAS